MKDPKFLRTILPLSEELDSILRRIFECDPVRRIKIPELRHLINMCPRFTATSRPSPVPLPSPPIEPLEYARDIQFAGVYPQQTGAQIPASLIPASPLTPESAAAPSFFPSSVSSESSGSDCESVWSATSSVSSASSASSTSSYTVVAPTKQSAPVAQPQWNPPQQQSYWPQYGYPIFQQVSATLAKHASFQPPQLFTRPVFVY